jgi:uncharacterized membrane protein
MQNAKDLDDQRLDWIIGVILRSGVIISAVTVLVGGILYLIHDGFNRPDYHIFHGEPVELRSIWGIIKDASGFHAAGIIQLGLLILIATPIVRVAYSIIGFALQRDRAYVMVTVIVLAVLLYSFTSGGVYAW